MLSVMLCGAADTVRVHHEFVEVVNQFGGDAWHYLSGQIQHVNSMQSSWVRNSRRTVQQADLCVFVIVETYGEVTWETELNEALLLGKPLLVFCLDSTYQKYLALSQAVSDPSAIRDERDRSLVATLAELESDRQFTLVHFGYGFFKEELRRQMANLFALCLSESEERNRRGSLARMLADPAQVTASYLPVVARMAGDEFEDKTVRKQAIRCLAARRAADEDQTLALLSSAEQGVQRFTVQSLPDLYVTRPVDPEFFDQCVTIASGSDDVGLARRLIPVLLSMDIAAAIGSFALLDLTEIGVRRRLAQALESVEAEIVAGGLNAEVAALLQRCREHTEVKGWLARCEAFELRLRAADAAVDNEDARRAGNSAPPDPAA